jgi:tetratricopeptide (TPR) repeat protein
MHLNRAQLLYSRGRYRAARTHLLKALAGDPGNWVPHALLAQCTLALGEHNEALRQAQEAVRLGPDVGHPHYVMAYVFADMGQLRDAERAIAEAIRLEPRDSAYFGKQASILAGMQRWSEALKAADAGLKLEPEDEECLNLRALSLTQLGRKSEAVNTIRDALQANPDNAFTHANHGWTCLHRGQYTQALDHFKNSLRLDPELEFARKGLVEALKARYLPYRILLPLFLRISRIPRGQQLVFGLGGCLGIRILEARFENWFNSSPYFNAAFVACLVLALLMLLAGPLFNMMLCFNRYGRYALSDRQRMGAYALLALLGGAAPALAIGCWLWGAKFLIGAMMAAALTFTVAAAVVITSRRQPGWRRNVLAGMTIILIGLGVTGWVLVESTMLGPTLLAAFGIGMILFMWVASQKSVSRSA